MRVAKIEEHHSLKEIENLLNEHKNDVEVYTRLLFIRGVKIGLKNDMLAKVLNISPQTCSKWLNKYNKLGFDGIKSYRSNSGVKSKLDAEDLKKLKKILTESHENYTMEEAREIIYLFFNVKYSMKQTWITVKKKLDLNYGKPFLNYYEKPEDYKKILKDRLKKITLDEVYFFLADESFFKNSTNVTRVIYDSNDKNIFVRKANKFGVSATGFLPVNGKPLIEIYDRNNSYTTIRSLITLRMMHMDDNVGKEVLNQILNNPLLNRENIKEEFEKQNKSDEEKIEAVKKELKSSNGKKKISPNKIKNICTNKKITPTRISIKQRTTIRDLLMESDICDILIDEKPIVIVVDNAKIHKATDVAIACEILNIELIYLPEYSPDLNPIEDLWKIIKRVTYTYHYKTKDELIDIIVDEFYKNVDKKSLTGNWVDEFL